MIGDTSDDDYRCRSGVPSLIPKPPHIRLLSSGKQWPLTTGIRSHGDAGSLGVNTVRVPRWRQRRRQDTGIKGTEPNDVVSRNREAAYLSRKLSALAAVVVRSGVPTTGICAASGKILRRCRSYMASLAPN
ncbi:hypothetical protein CSUI_010582 [Cystoisospora suis]|uniref:Uncharacterized protein n=1 Tax=Cystoisospora suis TaxID=483139 RepID=A0A2C6KG02_9APIC|nr:hypothetical protein CSUI_010582 [Cystoisospora suis]